MNCYYKLSVVLPHGAVGWPAVCDCGIFLAYSIAFLSFVQKKRIINIQYLEVEFNASILLD